jgi:3-oxoacyl-[acyl-carrier-protein] synthase-1
MHTALTALGIINALGAGKKQVLDNLLAGTAPGMCIQAGWLPDRRCYTGTVLDRLPPVPSAQRTLDCRNNQLLLAALQEIASDITAAISRYGSDRIGVVIGSSTSGILEGERALSTLSESGHWPENYHFHQQEISSPAKFVADYLGVAGPVYTLSTACSSSAKALASAQRLLALDVCDAVICGGADSLCKLTLHGFSALESVATDVCEPFAAGRSGITIGEGAALFLMERNRADAPGIQLAAVGESTDAHHISAPHPEGRGAEAAMRDALQQAALKPADIDYINLHGTATPLNDSMESAAVYRVFGSHTACSSTKPLTGHTLGAAGATEAGLCWLLLSAHNHTRCLPAQLNRLPPDDTLATLDVLRAARTFRSGSPLRAMSNSFAFGGSNACVILEACL